MPLTRSRFSSSVTTSRVWPEDTQRRSAVSTSSEVSTVITAGAGVITWRACCSCRWKTPVSIPASLASSLPPVTRLLDQHPQLLGRLALVELARRAHAEQPQDPVGRGVEQRR